MIEAAAILSAIVQKWDDFTIIAIMLLVLEICLVVVGLCAVLVRG